MQRPDYTPTVISEYGLLGDCHGSALVSRSGSIDWWCPPRFDASSVFGRLLDPDAGHWIIQPAGDFAATRRYLPDTMVLETEFQCGEGVLRLTDALAIGRGERGHELGHASPHMLLRRAEVTHGEVEISVEIAPRPEYGLVAPYFRQTTAGWDISGGADRLTLTAGLSLSAGEGSIGGTFTLRVGEAASFALHHRNAVASRPSAADACGELENAIAAWQSWSEMHRGYRGPTSSRCTEALWFSRRSHTVQQAR